MTGYGLVMPLILLCVQLYQKLIRLVVFTSRLVIDIKLLASMDDETFSQTRASLTHVNSTTDTPLLDLLQVYLSMFQTSLDEENMTTAEMFEH